MPEPTVEDRLATLEDAERLLASQFHVTSRAMLHMSNEMHQIRDGLTTRMDAYQEETRQAFAHVHKRIDKVEERVNGLGKKVDKLQFTFDEFVKHLPVIITDAVRAVQS